MNRTSPDLVGRQRHGQARWVALGLGLSLTLVGIAKGAQNASINSDTPDAREPSSVPAIPSVAAALTPPADGALLTGTVLFSKSADDRTIITDRRGRQLVYARGDELADGGVVVEIHRDYVVVRRGGRLETLIFSMNAATGKFEDAPQAAPPEDYRKVLRHAMFTNPGLLLELVGTTAVVEGGHFRGYRVMQPKDPALLESLGLKPGDILTGVNGVPISNTPDYGVQVLDALTGTNLIFTVQRGNQTLVVSD